MIASQNEYEDNSQRCDEDCRFINTSFTLYPKQTLLTYKPLKTYSDDNIATITTSSSIVSTVSAASTFSPASNVSSVSVSSNVSTSSNVSNVSTSSNVLSDSLPFPISTLSTITNNIIIRKLSNNIFLMKNIETIDNVPQKYRVFIRHHIPSNHPIKLDNMQTFLRERCCHPNIIGSYREMINTDNSSAFDLEFMDCGSLMPYINVFLPSDRLNVAKSITKQLLQALLYYEVVHNTNHRNINPLTIFLRRDGFVKFGVFNCLDKGKYKLFLNSLYCAPEIKTFDNLLNSGSKVDVWSVGVLIVAIMIGNPLYNAKHHKFQAFEEKETLYLQHRENFKNLLQSSNDKEWLKIIPDETLCFLAQRMLRKNPKERILTEDALALIYTIGNVEPLREYKYMNEGEDENPYHLKREHYPIITPSDSQLRKTLYTVIDKANFKPKPWVIEEQAFKNIETFGIFGKILYKVLISSKSLEFEFPGKNDFKKQYNLNHSKHFEDKEALNHLHNSTLNQQIKKLLIAELVELRNKRKEDILVLNKEIFRRSKNNYIYENNSNPLNPQNKANPNQGFLNNNKFILNTNKIIREFAKNRIFNDCQVIYNALNSIELLKQSNL